MSIQTIPITKDTRGFFRAYVELLKPFLKLRNRQADLFAELLYENYLRSDIKDKSDRFKLILEQDNRKKIEERLGMTTAVFRNSLTILRNKKLLDKLNRIPDPYLAIPEKNNFELKFQFIIKK